MYPSDINKLTFKKKKMKHNGTSTDSVNVLSMQMQFFRMQIISEE